MPVSRDAYCGCLFYTANAFARRITRMAEVEFLPTGLAPSSGFILMTVNDQPGISAGELARIMQLQPSTVTRLADRLEEEGFITRRSHRRFIHIYPTKKSSSLKAGLKTAWKSLFEHYGKLLGAEESLQLAAMLTSASDALEADE